VFVRRAAPLEEPKVKVAEQTGSTLFNRTVIQA
jgi:hypothetical protein